MSKAMPGGRSVVTLHGPSLAWRSASARRWRTESSVQASLRTMAECMASASESETSVMGMPTAWAHDTSVTARTRLFTITDCSGYQVVEAGKGRAGVCDIKVTRFAQTPANRKNPGVHHTARQRWYEMPGLPRDAISFPTSALDRCKEGDRI